MNLLLSTKLKKIALLLLCTSLIACQTAKKGIDEETSGSTDQSQTNGTIDTENTVELVDGTEVNALFGTNVDLEDVLNVAPDLPPILGAVSATDLNLACVASSIAETTVYWENNFDIACETRFSPDILDTSSVKLHNELAVLNLQGNARIDNFRYFKIYAQEVWGLNYTAGFGAGALPYFLCARGKLNTDYQSWLAARFPTKYVVVNGRVQHKGKALREQARAGINSRGIPYRGIFGCGNYACFLGGDCNDLGECIRGDNDCNSRYPNPLPAAPAGYNPAAHASPADHSS